MDEVVRLLAICKQVYDKGGSPLLDIRATAMHCLEKIAAEATLRNQATIGGAGGGGRRRGRREVDVGDEPAEVVVPAKSYSVFGSGSQTSRPFLPTLFLHDPEEFARRWDEVVAKMNPRKRVIRAEPTKIDLVLYTAINAFAICYDLWKPKSRKTPGTFWEVLIGSVLGTLLGERERGKSIPIPDQTETVTVDISFLETEGRRGLVFPAKITTRERIVQPFAHQRILDSVFGLGSFCSTLLCVSEIQRDEDAMVNEICVPGPIRLYQTHLAKLVGIYYLDPPTRYLQQDVASVIPVGTIGAFLTGVLPTLL